MQLGRWITLLMVRLLLLDFESILICSTGLNIGDASIRICYWDRPGYGFSDNSPTSSIPLVVAALSESLEKAGEYARLPAPRPELARSGFILVSR